MENSQTGIKYPNCPFIWKFNVLDETFNYIKSETDREDFINELVKKFASVNHTEQSLNEAIAISKFISDTTLNSSGVYTDIKYNILEQTACENDLMLDKVSLNFQTSAYFILYDNYIDQTMSVDVRWLVLSVVGSVTKKDDYTVVTNADATARIEYEDKIYERIINIFTQRCQDPVEVNQTDQPDDIFTLGSFNPVGYPKYRVVCRDIPINDNDNINGVDNTVISDDSNRRLPLNNRTRPSRGEIFDRVLNNKYKVFRLKHIPQLIPQQIVFGLSVPNVYENIVKQQEDFQKSIETIIPNSIFSFREEPANVISPGGIFCFAPSTTGLIKMVPHPESLSKICFVSMLVVESTLIVTLHKLTIIMQ